MTDWSFARYRESEGYAASGLHPDPPPFAETCPEPVEGCSRKRGPNGASQGSYRALVDNCAAASVTAQAPPGPLLCGHLRPRRRVRVEALYRADVLIA